MPTDTDPPTNPNALICFALYTTSHALHRIHVLLLSDLGLTYPQWMALMFLWESDNQAVGDLSTKMGLQTNTLTPFSNGSKPLATSPARAAPQTPAKSAFN